MDTYGILTSVVEINANMTLMGQYEYLINARKEAFRRKTAFSTCKAVRRALKCRRRASSGRIIWKRRR